MFVGHLALGFAAKRVDPRINLGWLVAAAVALDLVWPIFVLLGIERVRIVTGATAFTPLIFDYYPWSHSLTMSIFWGVLLALLARLSGLSDGSAWMIAALVVSHWVLDFISHAPDMPLWRGESPKLGLGLWNSIPATLIIEGAMWVIAIALYKLPRRASDWRGTAALWSFIVVTTIMWASGPWSPPPPSTRALGWFALIGWIVIPWSILADRYHSIRPTAISWPSRKGR